jgi:adenylate cyclase
VKNFLSLIYANVSIVELLRKGLPLIWLLVLIGHMLSWWHVKPVQWVDDGLEDWRARWQTIHEQKKSNASVVILDIDEASLASIGRWPWSRRVLADVVERAFHPQGSASVGVKALGLDLLLAEPERNRSADLQLSRILEKYPVTVGWFLSGQLNAQQVGNLPMPALPIENASIGWPQWYGHTMSLEGFDSVSRSGVINALFEDDGKIRRLPLLSYYEGDLYESLALSVWRSALPQHIMRLRELAPSVITSGAYNSFLEIQFMDQTREIQRIPLDDFLAESLRWRGRGGVNGGGIDYISVKELLRGHIASERLQGKYAVLGSTAAGLMDLRSTSVNPAMAGVELHALMIQALESQHYLYVPAERVWIVIAYLLMMSMAAYWVSAKPTIVRSLWVTIGCVAGWMMVNESLYIVKGWVIPMAAPIVWMIGWLFLDTFTGYWLERQQRKKFVNLFGQYVPPQLVALMAKDPDRYTMAPKTASLSILFSDVRDFTSIAETLNPEELREYINSYLTAMSDVISSFDGTLDKFIGDAVMAFWGAPVPDVMHAQKSVDAAVQMLDRASALSAKFVARGWPALRMGIGINTGDVRVGDMGSSTRRAYTVMGDAVNLASRLEGLCKYYGCSLIVSEFTRAHCSDVGWIELDKVQVKGKTQAVRIYSRIISNEIELTLSQGLILVEIEGAWEQMHRHFHLKNWSDSFEYLLRWRTTVSELSKQGICILLQAEQLFAVYAKRINDFEKKAPDQNWVGVSVHHEK